jgi:hypothetical protein
LAGNIYVKSPIKLLHLVPIGQKIWPPRAVLVSDLLLEPVEDFLQKFPVVMTPTLVDISQDVTNKERILNPFNLNVSFDRNY